MAVYFHILQSHNANKPLRALLLDPDGCQDPRKVLQIANRTGVAMVLVGGSEVHSDTGAFVSEVKRHTQLPVVLFPGHSSQFTPNADSILLLSLISGRNPDYLIEHHVAVAPALKRSGMEAIPTGYILIDGGCSTSVQRVSRTQPIASDAIDVAVATAVAGELLGMRLIYLEAGSGAVNPVPSQLIRAVRAAVDVPLIVGGGIRSAEQYRVAVESGANIVVVGNSVESNPKFLEEIAGL